MREFLFREFDALSALWQSYAAELTQLLDDQQLGDGEEIAHNLTTVENIVLDLDELLRSDGKNSLDKDRAEQADQLRICYRSLHKVLAEQHAGHVYETPGDRESSRNPAGRTAIA